LPWVLQHASEEAPPHGPLPPPSSSRPNGIQKLLQMIRSTENQLQRLDQELPALIQRSVKKALKDVFNILNKLRSHVDIVEGVVFSLRVDDLRRRMEPRKEEKVTRMRMPMQILMSSRIRDLLPILVFYLNIGDNFYS
ncbi:hypothetical protein HAX54_011431, partial [Datura stramonium]|nr:hypothetical protein [Datura stramonium]